MKRAVNRFQGLIPRSISLNDISHEKIKNLLTDPASCKKELN